MNLTATTDTAPEAGAEPKRRRRWWLIIPFFILASLVVFGVFVLSEGDQPTYRFLVQTRQSGVREFIHEGEHGPNYWFRMVTLHSDLPFDILVAAARKELPPSEWLERSQTSQFAFFDNEHLGRSVLLISESSGTEITVGQSHPATILDSIRLWFRDFGRQEKKKPEDAGSP